MSNKLISSKYHFLPLSIHVRVSNHKQIDLNTQVLIDTGFSGDIVVPITEELLTRALKAKARNSFVIDAYR